MIETPLNSPNKEVQHSGNPHVPIPPTTFALSRGPICRNSIRQRKTVANSFNNSLKSTLSSEVYINITFALSKVNSQLVNCISTSYRETISLHVIKASLASIKFFS